MEYDKLLEIRSANIDGEVIEWYWIAADGGPNSDGGSWSGPGLGFPAIRDGILKHLSSNIVMVQAGGCQGMYPRLWSKYFNVVYTFEPDSLNFFTLALNCQSERIIKFNTAVGNGDLVQVRRQFVNNMGAHMVEKVDNAGIPSIRIDDLKLPRCCAIQFDIEGSEFDAILGAIETIKKFKPIICLETAHVSSDVESLRKLLKDLKYVEIENLGIDTIFAPHL